ncbi:SUMF1/EgtB/PvdO family nonheme iron enzyme [Acidobacteriota bacterium]
MMPDQDNKKTDDRPPARDNGTKNTETRSAAANDTIPKSSFPRVSMDSVTLQLDRTGTVDPNLHLRDLANGFTIPELRTGTDKYQIVKTLGEGGMGKVFLVYDHDLKRRSALKVCRGSKARQQVRFLEEAQIMGQLQHPNILAVYDLGLSDKQKPYYIMPEVRGQTLREIIKGLDQGDPKVKRSYSLTRLIQVFLQVTQAMAYAHDKGVIHRDLKPSNIMLGEHGEVLVLDWGLSKVIFEGGIETDSSDPKTKAGRLAGTPEYMAPEQVEEADLDHRTDIYALGVLLYEILCLKRPFTGNQIQVITAVLRDNPLPPRAQAPDRQIPIELERSCLKAMRKRPEERHRNAQELHDEVQDWLEAESDRARRHERAEAKACEGIQKFEAFKRFREDVKILETELIELGMRFKGWQPLKDKASLLEKQDQFEHARGLLPEMASDVVTTLSVALGFNSENKTARRAMTEYYMDRFEEAESKQSDDDMRFFGKLVATYDDGKYSRRLLGDGTLRLDSDPTGAEVWLYTLEEEKLLRQPRQERYLGSTPMKPLPLSMGSYLVILKKEGFRDTRYPIYISRNRDWESTVNLYTDEEIGEAFMYVPAGPFIFGGDPHIMDWSLPRTESRVDDFFIARFPVTFEEYLEFLNHIAKTDLDKAIRRSPRFHPDSGSYLDTTPDGLLKFREHEEEREPVQPRFAVFGISWHDALAYCEWHTKEKRIEVRLPTEEEWEKAARGVDGRWFPWGNRFDPCLCNMKDSRQDKMCYASVDTFPTDISVYGIRGMGGNIRDWTATEEKQEEKEDPWGTRVVKGGGWFNPETLCRSCFRGSFDLGFVNDNFGFRLVRSAPGKDRS